MELARIILTVLTLIGGGMILFGVVMLVIAAGAQTIEGEIVDFVYHWTSRGIMRRLRIAYNFNDKDYFYDTKMNTLRRRTGPIKIKVGKHGTVFERAAYIYYIFLGTLAFGAGVYIMPFLK